MFSLAPQGPLDCFCKPWTPQAHEPVGMRKSKQPTQPWPGNLGHRQVRSPKKQILPAWIQGNLNISPKKNVWFIRHSWLEGLAPDTAIASMPHTKASSTGRRHFAVSQRNTTEGKVVFNELVVSATSCESDFEMCSVAKSPMFQSEIREIPHF